MRRVAFLALAAVLVACGGEPPPPERPPTPLDHTTTGTITGDVRFDGTPPPMSEVRFSGFSECAQRHTGTVLAGDAVVTDGRVANAFVYLKDGLGDRVFAVPPEPVVVGQDGCLFAPRVAGAQVGQTVKYVNADPLLHNVHGSPKDSSGWNVTLARQGAEREVKVSKPEVMVSVRCDLHPWMQGWLGVLPHPYFAVTGTDGAFTLRDVPPGEYTVAVWHERFGTSEAKATLAPKGTATARFSLTAK